MSREVRTAFVMGAGLGNRLRPLTDCRPKPLCPIFGKPLITFALDHLIAAGIEAFIINTHHLPGQFTEYFAGGAYRGRPVQLVFEPDLLETGGGIRNAAPWIGSGPFVVYSGDILTDVDLAPLLDAHLREGNDVTLALRDTGVAPGITLRGGRVTDIKGRYGAPGDFDFANISVWNAAGIRRIPEGKVQFIPVLAEWIGDGGRIGGVVLDDRQWFNIGSREKYLAVHRAIAGQAWKPDWVAAPDWPERISPRAEVAPDARIEGVISVGPGCVIGERAVIRDSILWDGVEIASGSRLTECIVRDRQSVSGIYDQADL